MQMHVDMITSLCSSRFAHLQSVCPILEYPNGAQWDKGLVTVEKVLTASFLDMVQNPAGSLVQIFNPLWPQRAGEFSKNAQATLNWK